MSRGRIWPAEWREYDDPVSGERVFQLTDYKGHSHHLYFTNPGWYDGGRRLLFGSDRENQTNLFSLDLESGQITQLTEFASSDQPAFQTACVNPARPEAYFGCGRDVIAINLVTFDQRRLWRTPEKFRRTMLNATADGRHLCLGITEDMAGRFRLDLGHGYIGFRETFEARPDSRILRVAVDGGAAETMWQEKYWIGHVNTSPTRPDLLTFCHEGPWELVDNRIWGLDLSTGKAWPIRPRDGREAVGHEYWLADGETVGYHGGLPDGRGFFGCVRYDNTGRVETVTARATGHMHSNDFSLIVGDGHSGRGGGILRLWKRRGDAFDGPRILCEHRGSFHIQIVHVHPRFTPDGRQVLFTSDPRGYGNVYLVDVPEDFDRLPPVEETAR